MVRRRDRCQAPPPKPTTEEPLTKRPKVDASPIEDTLKVIHENLLGNCLCSIPDEPLNQLATTGQLFDVERTLKFLSCVHMLCEVSLRQNSDGLMCSRVNELCSVLIRNEGQLVEQMIQWLADGCGFIGYAAGKALGGLLLVGRNGVEVRWLNNVVECALTTAVPRHMSVSLDVFKRVVDWKDKSQHPLEDRGLRGSVHPLCRPVSLMDTESPDASEVKCICIKVLGSKWPALVNKVDGMLSVYSSDYECAIVTFIALWESIISVKTNLSVIDTKPFYLNLSSFIALLNSSVPNLVWIQLLNLFNEVLCYGTTLALQDCLAEEPCALAHHVMRCVKDWRLLELLPQGGESSNHNAFTGASSSSTSSSDKILLQKMALLVLKSVAITVKETRYESSSSSNSDNSSNSSGPDDDDDDVDADMAVIERSIREVLRQLDNCIKSRLPFHPATPISKWIVQLFADQDDHLIESMICCLDVSVGLYYKQQNPAPANHTLSPTQTLISFLQCVSHDPELLLDLLVSNETCFLLYLLRVLKFMRRHWEVFVSECASAGARALDDVMTVFIRLRIAIDRLVSRALFPYNIGPVLRLLEKCEEFYESNSLEVVDNS